ncbi:hypothetical protein SynSYN20_00277 [Synechococcus sp. SYN20]|uniref:hypothetical protein n=1 Tax=Synechococcus sp. SYN20 TaxID=1050714 RepID=UPI0018606821|nr:hypothetical protein [Synechococcus sp. SYN20]QNJ24636.1 hypothetical protein SynSYN20_00277 [Synechococcus sp. SYN20]
MTAWTALQAEQPDLELCLHLCLTEAPCTALASVIPDLVNQDAHLKLSFEAWLSLSLLPAMHPRRRRITRQLHQEVQAQMARFRQLCGAAQMDRAEGSQTPSSAKATTPWHCQQ